MSEPGKPMSRGLIMTGAVLLTVALALVERFVHPSLPWLVFYLVPLLPAVWFGGFAAGLGVTALSAAAWTANAWLGPGPHPAFGPFLWDLQTRVILFLLISWGLGTLGASLRLRRILETTDTMTGLGTRRRFFESAGTELSRARRYKHPFSLVLIDIDGLRAVNRASGHAAGDRLLGGLALALRTNIRKSDFAARLGDDEFAVWLPETRFVPADRWVTRVRQKLAEAAAQGSPAAPVTVAAVTFQALPATVDEVLELADSVMAAAKKEDRGLARHEVWAAGGLVPAGTEIKAEPEA